MADTYLRVDRNTHTIHFEFFDKAASFTSIAYLIKRYPFADSTQSRHMARSIVMGRIQTIQALTDSRQNYVLEATKVIMRLVWNGYDLGQLLRSLARIPPHQYPHIKWSADSTTRQITRAVCVAIHTTNSLPRRERIALQQGVWNEQQQELLNTLLSRISLSTPWCM